MIRVAAAVLCRGGKILLARRAPGKKMAGLWEFPGGKLEPGEDAATALRRELREELSLDAEPGPILAANRHRYDFGEIELIGVLCRAPGTGPDASTDHDLLEWVDPASLPSRALAPADLPLAERLARGEWAALVAAA